MHIWKKGPKKIMGFGNLRSLKVKECNSLTNLFSPSIAKLLVMLWDIEAINCGKIEEILASAGEEEDENDVLFSQVFSILLEDLPNLKCPTLRTYFPTNLKTPQLKEVIEGDSYTTHWKGDLNANIEHIFKRKGNKPSSNSQFYSNHQTLSQFARLAKVYKAWKFYRIQIVKEAAQKGLPVCRHLFLHYPEDEHVHHLSYQQFLVGTEILVVPVLDKGKKNVKVYFPVGESSNWQHIWTGKLFTEQGCEAWVEAPIGYPAVFVKAGSIIGETFVKNLRDLEIL
ncbi:alpha-xylosidase 1 [Quercus suber]|uniref:Alpha-xylosidase 1 n=1 Tax=Quercus suber TaxID=58331 RepID=A0AAW0KP08_QUESU